MSLLRFSSGSRRLRTANALRTMASSAAGSAEPLSSPNAGNGRSSGNGYGRSNSRKQRVMRANAPSCRSSSRRDASARAATFSNDNSKSIELEVLSTEVNKTGKPLITVVGVGGAGGNAVNNMIQSQLEGVEFVVANTDHQALARSLAPRKIALGNTLTQGLGAGSKPELGRDSAELQRDEIVKSIAGSNMVFITGGMGGGTCTGAAPVFARIANELDILTVGVFSTPFRSEGPNRTRVANSGIAELRNMLDTLIVVPNQNLLAISNERTTMVEAFAHADNVLLEGVKGVTDLIVKPGLINLDFADINTILSGAGRAMMGSGQAEGVNRAEIAAKRALNNPLLGELPTEEATGLLVTISGSENLKLFEVDKIMEIIQCRVSGSANIIFGTCYDDSLRESIHVSIIVGGIQTEEISPAVRKGHLDTLNANHATTPAADPCTDGPDLAPKTKTKTGIFGRWFSF